VDDKIAPQSWLLFAGEELPLCNTAAASTAAVSAAVLHTGGKRHSKVTRRDQGSYRPGLRDPVCETRSVWTGPEGKRGVVNLNVHRCEALRS